MFLYLPLSHFKVSELPFKNRIFKFLIGFQMTLLSKIYWCCFFLMMSQIVDAQITNSYLIQTKVMVESVDQKDSAFEAYTNYSNLVLNTVNGDFTLKFDAADLKTGKLKLDSVLVTKGSQPIMFKGNMRDNLGVFNQQSNEEKSYNMLGQLFIKNSVIDCVATFDPLSFGEKSDTKNYRIDFKLVVDASKILILGLENKINQQFIIEVEGGRVNIQQ